MIVVAAVIFRDDKRFLICRKKPGTSHAGFWEFPGGKLKDNEIPESGLKREIMEELGISIYNLKLLDITEIPDKNSLKLITYTAYTDDQTLVLTDHDQSAWISPEELLNYKLCEADKSPAEKILQGLINNL